MVLLHYGHHVESKTTQFVSFEVTLRAQNQEMDDPAGAEVCHKVTTITSITRDAAVSTAY